MFQYPEKFCNQDGREIIQHNNISTKDINRGGVHLMTNGYKSFYINIVNHFKSNWIALERPRLDADPPSQSSGNISAIQSS